MTFIGFGTWAWGNKFLWGYDPEKEDEILEASFNEAVSRGLNFIDTADSYGIGHLNGRSEQLLGQFTQKLPPLTKKKLTIATKLAPYPWRVGRNGFRHAFQKSKERLRGNLKRVQLHWSTKRYAPWQEVQLIDGLGDLVQEGLVKEVGVSNMGPKRLIWFYKRLSKRGVHLKSLQIQFSLLSPNSIKSKQIQTVCQELDIEIIAYSPLAFGVLSIPPETSKLNKTFLRNRITKRLLAPSKKLRGALSKIAAERCSSQAQVALNWCRAHGTNPIPGIRNPSQAKDAALASDWDLGEEEVSELDRLKEECQEKMPSNPFQSK